MYIFYNFLIDIYIDIYIYIYIKIGSYNIFLNTIIIIYILFQHFLIQEIFKK